TIHPIVSNYFKRKEFIYKKYVDIIVIITQVSFVLCAYLIINAYDLVTVFFGKGWEDAVPLFQILSLSIPFQLLQTTTGSLFLALNSPDLYSKSGWINAFINLFLCFTGIIFGNLQFFTWMIVLSILINFLIS